MPEFYISSTKYSLQERQTKKHGKVYDVVFRIITQEGEEKQKKLSGYTTKTLAKQAYTDFVTQKCELVKNNPLKKKNTDKEIPIIGDLIIQYLASLPNQNKDSSIYDKRSVYNKFILPQYEKQPITVLTREELYRWQDKLWATKNPRTNDFYSYKYLTKVREHFSAFLSWCDTRYGYSNNLIKVAKPKRRAPKTQMQFWQREEFDRFIECVDDPMWHCFFTLLFYTGRRKGEIFAMTPEDIKGDAILFDKSLSRKSSTGAPYKITSTKADKTDTTPICEVVQHELKNYKGQSPFFFGGEKPLADNTTTRVFQKYTQKANLKQIRIHDLRHSFVAMLIHYGANVSVVADLIGDTIDQVNRTYAHLYETDRRVVLSKITRAD